MTTEKNFLNILDDLIPEEQESRPRAWLDTGSYAFNALLSGSIYGGYPDNKIAGLAGEEATGKTIFSMQAVRTFLDQHKDSICVYWDTEGAVDVEMLRSRGIDPRRVKIIRESLVERITHQIVTVIEKFKETEASKRRRMIFVLDSLGNVGTTKERDDAIKGEDKADMQRAKNIKKLFRIISKDLEEHGIPMLVPVHVYEKIGCALEGTIIKTSFSGEVDISNIKVGDIVETLVGPKPVINTFKYYTDEYYTIELEDNSVINLTGEHKLMVQDGTWKKVEDLNENDIVIRVV